MNEIETFTSVWDAIADTPEQSANLRARSELMQQIANIIIKTNNWKQADAALDHLRLFLNTFGGQLKGFSVGVGAC